MKKQSQPVTLGESTETESFVITLPAMVCRYLRFLATEEEKTPEAFIAEAAVSFTQAGMDGAQMRFDEDAERATAITLNSLPWARKEVLS